jgi:hypothetical protein
VRRPDVDTLFCINPDGSRNAIHPADVAGRFQRRKQALWLLLIAIYLAVPWLKVGGHPVLLIDIPHRHFYLLGHTFNAQDFWLAFFLVTGVGFALFMAAALFGRFDLILSNPPYIESAAIAGLMPEVARHEPASALDGGADGLGAYRHIVAELPRLLAPHGVAVLELGQGQQAAVEALARLAGLTPEACRADLGGVPRALVLRGA